MWAMRESRPRAGKKDAPVVQSQGSFHLALDFVFAEQVVRIQPLNVVAAAESECSVARGGCASIGLRNNSYSLRLKLARGLKRVVGRSIIDHNDFDITPGLSKGRAKALTNPTRSVISWDKNRDERRHPSML